jgi:lipopolysaccharide cholinephosphotransferase
MNVIKNKTTLEKLHTVEIEILDEAVRICEKNNLIYFLVGGTLLGAVRHKGFIPWDDDIDIGMPRKDYEKFIAICADELDNKYYLHDISTDKHYWQPFIKLRKKNTCLLEKENPPLSSNNQRGIYIDIFPYDAAYERDVFWKVKEFFIKKIRYIMPIKLGYKTDKKPFYGFVKFGTGMFSLRFLHWVLHRIMMAHVTNYKNITSWGGLYGYQKETFPLEDIIPVAKLTFDGKSYNVPNQWDRYLKQIYGDYMQLPPEDKRTAHMPELILFDSPGV